ncbi:MAG: hypothetical protein GKC10_08675 [Methanosarcinales archaeon]|nr:hypothetical protein [Methanosarcinales archaeon]
MRTAILTTIVGLAVILLISFSQGQVPIWQPGSVPYYPSYPNYQSLEVNLSPQYDWLMPDYLYQGRYVGYAPYYYYDIPEPRTWLWGGLPVPYPDYGSYRYEVKYPIYRWPDHPLQDPYSFISSNVGYGYVGGQPVVVLGKSWMERFNQSAIIL